MLCKMKLHYVKWVTDSSHRNNDVTTIIIIMIIVTIIIIIDVMLPLYLL
jgi:hypothetical protein